MEGKEMLVGVRIVDPLSGRNHGTVLRGTSEEIVEQIRITKERGQKVEQVFATLI